MTSLMTRPIARQTAPVEPQTAVHLTETAVIALQGEAESAGLLVVGSRGRGGAIASRLGSTAIVLAQQASCPVVVVPSAFGGPFDVETGRDVVVGVDGSQTSQRAVEFAFAEDGMVVRPHESGDVFGVGAANDGQLD